MIRCFTFVWIAVLGLGCWLGVAPGALGANLETMTGPSWLPTPSVVVLGNAVGPNVLLGEVTAPTTSPEARAAETEAIIADLRQKAFAASNAGQFAEAEEYWSLLLAYLPDEAALWSNRGNVRLSQNQPLAAIADYDQAVALAPDQPDPYLNRGAALERLERWTEAIADYSRVLDINPDDAAAYNNRGNAKAGLGDWDAALADYQQAVALDPKFAFARVNAALATSQLGNAEDAIREFRNLTRRYPNFADARAALTAALWAKGQPGEAESNWVAVMGLDSRYKNLDWVAQVRRWPPTMVAALDRFLHL